jgi:hypothetical protein
VRIRKGWECNTKWVGGSGMLMDTDWEDIRHVAGLMGFDAIDFTARLEDVPLSGPVEGTICIKRKWSKVERRYRYDDSLINGDSAWSVTFGCDLASGEFGNVK